MNEENKNEQNKNKQKKSEETIKFHCTQCHGNAFSSQRHHQSRYGCTNTFRLCTGLDCPLCPLGK